MHRRICRSAGVAVDGVPLLFHLYNSSGRGMWGFHYDPLMRSDQDADDEVQIVSVTSGDGAPADGGAGAASAGATGGVSGVASGGQSASDAGVPRSGGVSACGDSVADAGATGGGAEPVWRRFTPEKIDETLCLAREWGGGRGLQCKKAPKSGCRLCGKHSTAAAHGLVTGEIPAGKLMDFERAAGKLARGGGGGVRGASASTDGVESVAEAAPSGIVQSAGGVAEGVPARDRAAGAAAARRARAGPDDADAAVSWPASVHAALRAGIAERRAGRAEEEAAARARESALQEEYMEDVETAAAASARSAGPRDLQRSARVAERAEARRHEASVRGGLSADVARDSGLRAEGEQLFGALREEYTRRGMGAQADALVLGRSGVTRERVERMRRTLQELRAGPRP